MKHDLGQPDTVRWSDLARANPNIRNHSALIQAMAPARKSLQDVPDLLLSLEPDETPRQIPIVVPKDSIGEFTPDELFMFYEYINFNASMDFFASIAGQIREIIDIALLALYKKGEPSMISNEQIQIILELKGCDTCDLTDTEPAIMNRDGNIITNCVAMIYFNKSKTAILYIPDLFIMSNCSDIRLATGIGFPDLTVQNCISNNCYVGNPETFLRTFLAPLKEHMEQSKYQPTSPDFVLKSLL